jgi:hypothetical protein
MIQVHRGAIGSVERGDCGGDYKPQTMIVAGETVTGKTTQLPKICLEVGRTFRT